MGEIQLSEKMGKLETHLPFPIAHSGGLLVQPLRRKIR